MTQSTVEEQEGAWIAGHMYESSAELSLPDLGFFDVELPSENLGNRHLEPEQTMTLAPGAYSGVFVKPRAELTLTSGTYYFDSLVSDAESILRMDTSAGPIRIYVAFSLQHHGEMTDVDATELGDIFVGYFGTAPVYIESGLDATLVAPNAKIILASAPGDFHGAYYGMQVEARPDVTIWHRPFFHPWIDLDDAAGDTCWDGDLTGDETDVDCGGSCPPCGNGQNCLENNDCQSKNCDAGACQPPPAGCSEITAVDLGRDGEETTVPGDGCVKIGDEIPDWWETRNLLLQNTNGSGYPLPFTWTNGACGPSGSDTFQHNWNDKILPNISEHCPTLIDLHGDPGSSVTLRYYGS
jgi:hypothetical protein